MNKLFENVIKEDLHWYLRQQDAVDEKLPECPDLEEKWTEYGGSYMPDGIREFNNYPTVSLGWVMFLGMAAAKYWDQDWVRYGRVNIYEKVRDARGYDYMDEYILEDVLGVEGAERKKLNSLVETCAEKVNHTLRSESIEPGTKLALEAYISAIHQMYLMGIAIELKRLGYHMTKMNIG